MEPEILGAILGGIFAILAAFIPFLIKKVQERKNAGGARFAPAEGLAVVIGVVQRDSEILMVRRRVRYRGLSWQFPAGVVKPGEEMQDTVESEVLGETGIRCKVQRYMGARVQEETKVLCHYFYCTYLDGEARNMDEHENSQVAWIHVEKVRSYITSSLYSGVEKLLEEIQQTLAQPGVVLGVVMKDGKVLLVKRKEAGKKPRWKLPGGTMEIGETEEQAVIREVFEETGITCSVMHKLGERQHPQTKQQIHYWQCAYIEGIPALTEPEKFNAVMWMNATDAIPLLGKDVFEPVKERLKNAD